VYCHNGRHEDFDQVVLTMAAPIAARVCAGLSAEERGRLNGIQYQGIICASLLLDKPLAGFYVTNITEGWVPFTAVIEMSALVDQRHFGGKSLVYLPKYVLPDDPAFSLSDAEIEERFVPALLRMYPHLQRSDIQCFRVSRVRQVLAVSTLNYSARLPAVQTSLPGVHILNSAHILNGTLNANETVQLAERSVQQLLAAAQLRTHRSQLEPRVSVFSLLPLDGGGFNSVRPSLGTGGHGSLLPLGEGQDEGDRPQDRSSACPHPSPLPKGEGRG
jgi:protoporphyrinogen oxidase